MMTRQERLMHAVAFEAARQVEEVLPLPTGKRALRFFEVLQAVKGGLEEFSRRRWEREDRILPGGN
jgi:hypothetical protein